jgi:DNA repair protein RecN (Recombination protein N)
MLNHLSIRNLAVVKSLDIDFSNGLTTITGETGAGKSIAIDALGLCLGDRAEANMVRTTADKAEVSVSFDLSQLPNACAWLKEHDLDDQHDCLIRRVISAEGRSKAYINGTIVPLLQLKKIGQFLISIHGQHAHQQLLKSDVQMQVVDNFADHPKYLSAVATAYKQYFEAHKRYIGLQASQQQRADRRQLLEYQVKELDEFDILEDEFLDLEREHKKLSHSQTLLEQAQVSFHQLYDAEEFNALAAVQNSLDRIAELQDHDPALVPIVNLLSEASINIDEASQELRAYTEQLEIDPLKMQQVEARYSQALELARKHKILPETLYSYHQALANEFNELASDDSLLVSLATELEALKRNYLDAAIKLSESRKKTSKKLAKSVEQQIHMMNMQQACFSIEVMFSPEAKMTKSGLDTVVFRIATNLGQAADSLDRVVCGGVLSRIGLAVQVISSSNNQVPTMIFDEVDTGISGPTASVVGKLLRKLGQSTQVMCVTHLPQVAACGHNQMFVTKYTHNRTTETQMISLTKNERIDELARLLGGDQLTDSAIANAKELLSSH